MDLSFIPTDTWWYTWLILPFLIMLARMADQSIGTLRLVFVAKGYRLLAPAAGFIESIIWLAAVSQILQHVGNIACIIAYGLGFAIGNYFGILIEEKISLGRVIVRVIANRNLEELMQGMRESHFGLTIVDGQGRQGAVKLIFSVIARKDVPEFVAIVNKWNPNGFYSIEEVKAAKEGVFRPMSSPLAMRGFGLRKAK